MGYLYIGMYEYMCRNLHIICDSNNMSRLLYYHKMAWAGFTKPIFPFHYFPIFQHCQNTGQLLITLIFDWFQFSPAVATRVKYSSDLKDLTGISVKSNISLTKLKNGT